MNASTHSQSLELRLVSTIRSARAEFFRNLVLHATNHISNSIIAKDVLLHKGDLKKSADEHDEQIDMIKSEHAYQIAEFFFLIEENKVATRSKIAQFLSVHNNDMKELANNPNLYREYGITADRIKDAVFSEEQIQKVVENIENDKILRLDQADLGRILATVMSPETCRLVTKALAYGGLLSRINIGRKLIRSNGIIEEYFRKHLSIISFSLVQEHTFKGGNNT